MTLENIAFIGAGKMASAIAAGLVNKNLPGEKIFAFDVAEDARNAFRKAVPGANCEKDLVSLLSKSSFIVLAVKPQYVKEALAGAEKELENKLLLSICAGINMETLEELSLCKKIIRVMPNTPALVGAGMSAFTCSSAVSSEEKEMAEKVLSSIGEVREVPEKLLDAVTGLSGSGPAYVMEFIMALADGGVYMGLPRDAAYEMALQTVIGTAALLKKSSGHPAILRDGVISPGGTTARGVEALDAGRFRHTVMQAVIKAAERSAELGKKV